MTSSSSPLRYTFAFDTTTWGWIHLVLGIVLALTGFFLFTGREWARVVGVMVAVLSIFANFLWLPYYPLWAIVVIAVDVLVIWAITSFEPLTDRAAPGADRGRRMPDTLRPRGPVGLPVIASAVSAVSSSAEARLLRA